MWAVRSARVFNFMTPEEAAKLGIRRTTAGCTSASPTARPIWGRSARPNGSNSRSKICPTATKLLAPVVDAAKPLQRRQQQTWNWRATGADWRISGRQPVARMVRLCPRRILISTSPTVPTTSQKTSRGSLHHQNMAQKQGLENRGAKDDHRKEKHSSCRATARPNPRRDDEIIPTTSSPSSDLQP